MHDNIYNIYDDFDGLAPLNEYLVSLPNGIDHLREQVARAAATRHTSVLIECTEHLTRIRSTLSFVPTGFRQFSDSFVADGHIKDSDCIATLKFNEKKATLITDY